jgi:hypothetical protein
MRTAPPPPVCVEIVASAEHVDGNVGFLNGSAASGKRLLHHVTQESLSPAAAREGWVFEHLLQVRENLRLLLFAREHVGMNCGHKVEPPGDEVYHFGALDVRLNVAAIRLIPKG